MGSCSNKASDTKNGIREIVITKHSENSQKPQEKKPPAISKYKLRNAVQSKVLKPLKFQQIVEAETAVITNPEKSEENKQFIKRALEKNFVFSHLSTLQIERLITEMKLFQFGPNEKVFTKSKPGKYFFIVLEGKLSVQENETEVFLPGSSCGEIALLQSVPRKFTLRTEGPAKLWGIERAIFGQIVSEINSKLYEENKKFIDNTEVFKELTAVQKEALIQEMNVFSFKEKSVILKEGDSGDLLYIIKEGLAVCSKNGEEIGKLSQGECFGEQALFFDCPRTATVTAETQVACLCITNQTLIKVFGSKLQDVIYKNMLKHVIKNNQYLKKLSKLQEEILVKSFVLTEFEDADLVIKAGVVKSKDLIIVIKGSLSYSGKIVNRMSCVGDFDIVNESKEAWITEVRSIGKTVLALISKDQFENAIGGKYADSVGNNNKLKLLKNVGLLRYLTNEQLNEIVNTLKVEEFADGMNVFLENDPGDSLFLVKSGSVEIIKKGTYMRTVGKNDYFGERAILFGSPRTATAKAKGRVIVFILLRSDFLRIINEKIKFNLIKRIELQDESIQLTDLKIVKVLGKGLTGRVFLAVHQTKKTLYALKTVNRQIIFDYNMYGSIKLERQILLQLDHVFIMKLVKTFKDPKRVFFLTEYVRGMDLFDVIRNMSFITEPQARFFVCSLLLVLETLQEKHLVYRDLKPENVVVDDEGYLKLIDFGTAKFVNSKTYTFLGTPQYMAPEVILNTGYNYSADYWSLGVMMFEFLFGYVPFGEQDVDPMAVYEKVIARKIEYPNIGDLYTHSKALIEQLLSKNPALRDDGSIESLKSHFWFIGFEWDLLASRQMATPYVPNVGGYEREIETALSGIQDLDKIIAEQEEFKGKPEEDCIGWDIEF